MVDHRWHPLNDVFVWLSRIGTWGAVWVALGLVAALLLRRPPLLVAVILADAAAQGIAGLLKTTTGIERPPRRYPDTHALVPVPHDGSFPSGHTTSSFACATVLAAAVPKAAPALYLLALAIGFSRTSATRTRLSGTVAGSSIPASRSASRISVASPMKKTSFPRAPVCQPVTESVSPSAWLPAYQSVNAETASTSPEIHARRSPQ